MNNYDLINVDVGFGLAYALYRRGVAIELLYDNEDEECSMIVHRDMDTDLCFIDITNRFSAQFNIDYIDNIRYLIDAKGDLL